MLENWEMWKPEIDIANKYYVDSVIDNIYGLSIILSESENENKKIEIIFDSSMQSYRSVDESYRLNTINYIDEIYGANFYSEWSLFKVSNSEYLEWLSNQSYGISKSEELMHFSIIAVDSIIDVIAAYEPKIIKLD